MRKSDFTLPTLDDLFSTQAERDDAKLERVRNIPLAELHPFKGHPFKVQNNEEMQRMIESIRKVGAITPALARPLPDGAVNFAFIGQFAETPRDTIFTTEYSMRTGMESVYTLLDIDRGVPEVWGSKYDVRELLRACYYAIDKKPITDIKLSFKEKMLLKVVMKKVKGTDVELLLKESGLIE